MANIKCLKFKSINIKLLGEKKKGFSIGKAVVGGLLTDGIGTLAGFVGKKGKYDVYCLNCGNRFKIK